MLLSILTQVRLVFSLFSLCILTLIPSVSLFAAQFPVGAAAEFRSALGKAKPGDEIVIKNGTYQNWDRIEIPSEGTESAPIIIKAESSGKVIFTGNNNEFILTGAHIVLKGLKFIDRNQNDSQADGIVWFKGAQNSRLTECVFDKIADQRVIAINRQDSGREANHNRIDHCEFRNITSQIIYVWVSGEGRAFGTKIDNNVFKDNTYLNVEVPMIRVGSNLFDAALNVGMTFENNTFINCIADWNLLHHKASGIVHRKNYFENSSNITLRQGSGNAFEQNTFVNIDDRNTGVIRVLGKNHRIVNNIFIGNANTSKAISFEYGSGDEIAHYQTPSGALVANNTIVGLNNYGISIGERKNEGSNDGTRNKAPHNNIFINNIISMSRGELINVIDSPQNQISNNLLHTTRTATIGTKGDNAILSNPMFVSSTQPDYQLQEGSPAIDQGKPLESVTVDFNGSMRPNGGDYDIGAFEFQTTVAKVPQAPTQLRLVILP